MANRGTGGANPPRVRRVLWSVATAVVLAVRLLSTIVAVFSAFAWLVAAVRSNLLNGWLWWALGSAVALLLSTFAYSYLRVRYPSFSDRWED